MKTIDLLVQALPAIGGWPEKVTHIGQDYDRELMFYGRGNLRAGIFLDQLAVDHRKCGEVGTKITREQYEAALTAKNDGWIEWGGGECPVARDQTVDVMFRYQETTATGRAGCWRWDRNGTDSDIIAYRLHQPQEAEQAKADDEADLNECIGQTPAPVWNGEGLPPVGCECEFISNDTSWGPVVVIGMDGDKVVIKPSGETYYGITPSEKQVFRPTHSEAERKREKAVQALCNAGGGIGRVDEESGYGSCWFDIYDAIADGKIPGVKLGD